MQIEGSIRANLIAALASVKRLKGTPVHKDTLDHWRRLLEYGGVVDRQPGGEKVSDLLSELEFALRSIVVEKPVARSV